MKKVAPPRALIDDDPGQDLIEYALVACVFALGVVVALATLNGQAGGAFNSVGNSLTSAF